MVYILQLLGGDYFTGGMMYDTRRILAQSQATWGLIMIRLWGLWGLWGMICGEMMLVLYYMSKLNNRIP